MTRRLVVWLFGAALVLGALAAAGSGGAIPDEDRGLLQPQTDQADFENTVFEITVFENGTAEWTVRYIQPLDNESEVNDFRAFADRFNAEELAIYERFTLRAERIVAAGRNVTDRPMAAGGFSRHAAVLDEGSTFGQTRGVLEMSFQWSAFARQDGSRVVVGDVFEGGLYLGGNQRLVFQRGPTLGFASVAPQPDSISDPGNLNASSSVTWFGQLQFPDQRPYLELGPRGSLGSEGTPFPESPGATDPQPGGGDFDFGPEYLLAGLVVFLAIIGGFAYYIDQTRREGGDTTDTPASAEDGPGAQATGADSGPVTPASAVPEEELLSDEDRVLRLLDENGGRMKQVSIVEQTDWSKSKVSMLLSDMEEDGHISKLRLGRENIISLTGQEPDAAGSPFDDEE